MSTQASDARNAIFAKINAVDASRNTADPAAVKARLETPPPQPLPAISTPDPAIRADTFVTKAIELGCTLADCANMEAVPQAVADYLKSQNINLRVALPADADLSTLGWPDAGITITTDMQKSALDGITSVTRARAGVAETGAVAVSSSSAYPVSLGLLPDRHIMVLRTNEVVGGYEDVWKIARAERDNQGMTRALIFVGGPSRTADIEATLVMGAHGPRAVHIILVA